MLKKIVPAAFRNDSTHKATTVKIPALLELFEADLAKVTGGKNVVGTTYKQEPFDGGLTVDSTENG
jgi:hypothetical protein